MLLFTSLKSQLSWLWYRTTTVVVSFKALYGLPKEKLRNFMQSYKIFDMNMMDNASESKISDYYGVINHLCAIGEVEKMYIPPVVDIKKSLSQNQILFENHLCTELKLKENSKVLELGSGRGRIAAHVNEISGAEVYGINIDVVQVINATNYAAQRNKSHKLHFINTSYNNLPLPFEDNFLDAIYEVQALTYASEPQKLFDEMYRVLKPGGRVVILDWFSLPNYNPSNPVHKDLMQKCKPLVGAVWCPYPDEMCKIFVKSGFKVLKSDNASVDGFMWPMIEKANTFFNLVNSVVNFGVFIRILPPHFKMLFDRFSKDGCAFIEADKLRILTAGHEIIAVKTE